ncbi:Gfo/Idh/MocA family protein [uncultured Oscillibacter sp.]|uniref:Gfo/Idh/MocA family protein n=1 Tax=uncultured Oscillibacter sp. TaxID=876091 RepID=UPI0027299778|nr:Gfo/Idh/MocA family oxidoreductase [uncultured Oscillibacter sp.]
MKTVTIALIGSGFAAEFHAKAYSSVSGIEVKIKYVVNRNLDKARNLAVKWKIPYVTSSYADVLRDPEVDVVDIVLPPSLHLTYARQAMEAGKHVVCEKPLTGYFGRSGDTEPIGVNVSKEAMYEALLREITSARQWIQNSPKNFFYAENYLYAPGIMRMADILRKKGSKILYMKGECGIRGSTSPVAGHWSQTGGGALIRLGCHTIAGMLWLKQQEASARGEIVSVQSISADTGRISGTISPHERRHLTAAPMDVEEFAAVTITFSDGSKAVSLSSDSMLGGIQNRIEVYTNDSAMQCNITPSNNLQTYFLDQDRLEDVYISEQLKEKTGWNQALVAEEVLRGYRDQFQDFVECIAYDRDPVSGIELASETIRLVYAAYVSAEAGCRVSFDEKGRMLQIRQS